MTAAMVLGAGLGTRLRPLTDHIAKALVPVGDAPMLAGVIARVRALGCGPVVVNAHHRRREVESFCRDAGVLVSPEDDLLGTAGGIAAAAKLLGEGDVLVHNGDVIVDGDLAAALASHDGERGATLVVIARAAGEGNVGFDDSGRVVRLRTETFAEGESHGGEFTGVHVVSARIRAKLPQKGCIVGDVYMPRLRGESNDLYVYIANKFVDVGSRDGYLRANLEWLAARKIDSFIGDGAIVGRDVTLVRSIIGANARVEGSGVMRECVVWPSAIARAPLESDVVATPRT